MKLKNAFILFVLLAGWAPAYSQVFSPGTPLKTLKTEHFTIIYPSELEGTAAYLQSFAEEVYGEVAKALEVPMNLRLPVLLTPETQRLNGYFDFSPARIVLYAAPPLQDAFPLAYDDLLRKIFLHELTHAVSLSVRAPFWEFLAQVFSERIAPAQLIAPWSFVEGVTVALESAEGLGRAVDTPFRAQVKQDLLEGRFESFAEAGGISAGRYPYGSRYSYGGLFSRYLLETYGPQKYAKLWKALGGGNVFTGFEGLLWFKGAFEETYGLTPEAAWSNFARSQVLPSPVVMTVDPLSDLEAVGGLDADARQVVWADSRALRRMDRTSGKVEELAPLASGVHRISLSPDGQRLLVSGFIPDGSREKAQTAVFNLRTGSWEPASGAGDLLEAAWLPDGRIVGVKSAGFAKNIVVAGPEGTSVLFRGTHRLVPHLPGSGREGEAVFLLEEDGVGKVIRQNLETGSREVLKLPETMTHVRYLSSREGTLVFSFDGGEGLYRLASADSQGLKIQPALLSGGVQFPVFSGDEIFYRGHFSQGQKVLRYPAENPALTLTSSQAGWEPYELTAADLESRYDSQPAAAPENYHMLAYMLRPILWVPTANVVSDPSLAGAGIWGQWMDPTEALPVTASAVYLWNTGFLNSTLSLTLPWNGVQTTLTVSDSLMASPWFTASNPEYLRLLQAEAQVSLSRKLPGALGTVAAEAAAGAQRASRGLAGSTVILNAPYSWPLTDPYVPFGGAVSWWTRPAGDFQPQGTWGASLSLGYGGWFLPGDYRAPRGVADVQLGLNFPWMNLRTLGILALAGHEDVAISSRGPLMKAGSVYPVDDRLPDWSELQLHVPRDSRLGFFLSNSLGYSFQTWTPLPFYNFFVRSLDLSGGLRSYGGAEGSLHSAYGALTVNLTIARGQAHRLVLRTRLEAAKAFNSPFPVFSWTLTPVTE